MWSERSCECKERTGELPTLARCRHALLHRVRWEVQPHACHTTCIAARPPPRPPHRNAGLPHVQERRLQARDGLVCRRPCRWARMRDARPTGGMSLRHRAHTRPSSLPTPRIQSSSSAGARPRRARTTGSSRIRGTPAGAPTVRWRERGVLEQRAATTRVSSQSATLPRYVHPRLLQARSSLPAASTSAASRARRVAVGRSTVTRHGRRVSLVRTYMRRTHSNASLLCTRPLISRRRTPARYEPLSRTRVRQSSRVDGATIRLAALLQ